MVLTSQIGEYGQIQLPMHNQFCINYILEVNWYMRVTQAEKHNRIEATPIRGQIRIFFNQMKEFKGVKSFFLFVKKLGKVFADKTFKIFWIKLIFVVVNVKNGTKLQKIPMVLK